MDLQLKDKVIMVAAASQGMGYAIARQCALEGAKVSMASRDKMAIEAAAETIRAESGTEVRAYQFDARDGGSIERWVADTIVDLGPVNGLLVNAGGPPTGQFESFDDNDWQAAFELTLMSAVRLIRAVLPSMKQTGGGSILTLTSSSVKEPIDVLILSNVMRSGVTSLVKSLSQQLAGDKIRVNNIIPGLIDTQRVQGMDQAMADKLGISREERKAQVESTLPWGRYGRPEEFANAATFLLSEAASYITGASLTVDGGKMKTVW
ncbi:SDR family oxidoreductase [Gynuella sunshinyii]|uniref:Dehydrogenases with different specificities (Related to short-chain alcohol dehydrogenase) n=1 Tax=Gynuella sunshinyii YC6258 TaxID=1445510 RepID=A0A0C5VTF6_9GAMM|nr:SDR family oxidoreductase [Gynuella sunshinyii]AJQ93599.1 dehydrogenases with different specificities (related to short-chain alcohol dehydrogenase) [Gynuella sunshinyii YC6258]